MNNTKPNDSFFETSDLSLASVLQSLNYPLDRIIKIEPHKSVFVFLRGDDLDSIISDFWARKLRLEPISVLTNLKLLKNRLYSNET